MNAAELVERVRRRRSLPPPALRRAIRLAGDLTLTAIGEAMSPPVTATAVYHWERGERMPSGDYLQQYLTLLDDLMRVIPREELERLGGQVPA